MVPGVAGLTCEGRRDWAAGHVSRPTTVSRDALDIRLPRLRHDPVPRHQHHLRQSIQWDCYVIVEATCSGFLGK